MSVQSDKARAFAALHEPGDPVILFNIWDPGSAGVVAGAGAAAIATGSAPVAMANGFTDGENIPFDLVLDNVRRIVAATDLPVTMDLEGAYAVDPAGVEENAARALGMGVVGFNFEDQIVGRSALYSADDQARRVEAMRAGCDKTGVAAFINARTDIFLKAAPETHSAAMLEDAIARARAYGDAGASGFFAPGLKDAALIGQLCAAVDLPVNIIALPGVPANAELAKLGVARISYGPVPYRRMLAWLEDEAKAALESLA